MTGQVRIRDAGGTIRTIQRIRVRDAGGVIRTIQRIRVRDETNTIRTVFEYFSVSVTPTSITQTGTTSTIVSFTTADVTVVGGVGPFSYSWVNQFGDPIFATSPTSASTTFRKSGMAPGDSLQASFICNVTDSFGNLRTTEAVEVFIERTP